ncbi:RAC family serine/threonine-protein kinase-like protein [Diplonema papillatum]|nr:RAC family serine/threonine-protein kinase-like protein [Diplonema papillatum]
MMMKTCTAVLVSVCFCVAGGVVTVIPLPSALLEDSLREGNYVVQLTSTDMVSLEGMRRALPDLFHCATNATSIFKSRSRQILQASPPGSNVACVCSDSCGASGTQPCNCVATWCERLRIELQADAGFDLATPEEIVAVLPAYVFSAPPPDDERISNPMSITPTGGVLTVSLGASTPQENITIAGDDLIRGPINLTLTLMGETWKQKFPPQSVVSDVSMVDEPFGFESFRTKILPDLVRVGPVNVMHITLQQAEDYLLLNHDRETLTFGGGSSVAPLLFESGLSLRSHANVFINKPVNLTCSFPFASTCSGCVDGYYGLLCSKCPGNGDTCSGNAECLAGAKKCSDGCHDGMQGTGLCTCLIGWGGASCDTMTTEALTSAASSSVAVGSLLMEIAAGGSPAAPITAITQLQFIVLLGIQQCSPVRVRALASSVTWILNPFYGSIYAEYHVSEDILHMRQSYAILFTSYVVHILLILALYLYQKKNGWSFLDTQDFLWFPNLQVLITLLLLCNSVSSSAGVLTENGGNWLDGLLAALLLVAYLFVLPIATFWFLNRSLRSRPTPKTEFLSRNVANSPRNAARIVYTSKRAEKMPAALAYFLPSGFWTSLHLPDRGFFNRWSLLFDEYRARRSMFMIVQVVKLLLYSATLGTRVSSHELCETKMFILTGFVCVFAFVISWQQPFNSLGSNILHGLIAWCNAGVCISILSELRGGGEGKAHIFLIANTCLLIVSAIWNFVVFVLGKTVYKVRHVQLGSTATPSPQNRSELSDYTTITPRTTETATLHVASRAFWLSAHRQSDIPALVAVQATHVGEIQVKMKRGGYETMWLELRGPHLLYYKSAAEATDPLGGADLASCRAEYKSKKKKVVITDLVYDEDSCCLRAKNATDLEGWFKAVQSVASPSCGLLADGPILSTNLISRYVEIGSLGRGAYGEVVKVRGIETGKEYALKRLHARTGNELPRILNEISVLQLLRHPFLVSLVEAIEDKGTMHLIMTLLSGGDLGMHLKEKGSLTREQVVFYTAQVVLALDHLHANGVLYRDLKPANIVLDSVVNGNAVLTDMGIATMGLNASTFCGTPYYLAPEVVRYNSYNQSVDWWALGVVVYELLFGVTPFAAEEMTVTFQLIEMRNPIFPAGRDDDAEDLVSKLLVKKPEKRLTSPKKIKKHRFYDSISFDALLSGHLRPPDMAALQASPEDRQDAFPARSEKTASVSRMSHLSHVYSDTGSQRSTRALSPFPAQTKYLSGAKRSGTNAGPVSAVVPPFTTADTSAYYLQQTPYTVSGSLSPLIPSNLYLATTDPSGSFCTSLPNASLDCPPRDNPIDSIFGDKSERSVRSQSEKRGPGTESSRLSIPDQINTVAETSPGFFSQETEMKTISTTSVGLPS